MKQRLLAALLAAGTLTLNAVHADITHPISSAFQAIQTAKEFDMDKYEEFRDSSGVEVYIYASKKTDNRFLVLDSSWSPISYFTSSMTEEKARNAGLEFAKSYGVKVELAEPKLYYYNGSYGYGFNVTELE